MIKRGCQKTLLKIFILYLAVTYISAAIFMLIEFKGLDDKKSIRSINSTFIKNVIEKRLNLKTNCSDTNEIISIVSDGLRKLDKFKKSEWKKKIGWNTFFRWLYFVRISAATVGYGDIVPETDGAKLFLIPFAIIAIPSHMLLVAAVGFIISDFFNSVDAFLTRWICKKPKRPGSHTTALFMLVSVCVIWILFSGLITKRIKNWQFIDGLYAAFVTFTTIGYGDFIVEGENPLENELMCWYATVGLTLVAAMVDMILKIFQTKVDVHGAEIKFEMKRNGDNQADNICI